MEEDEGDALVDAAGLLVVCADEVEANRANAPMRVNALLSNLVILINDTNPQNRRLYL